jgi:hypothetical protein
LGGGEGGRQIKNDQSARRVPVHPELERLGFLAYVTGTAPKATDMVFPLLKPGGPKMGYPLIFGFHSAFRQPLLS